MDVGFGSNKKAIKTVKAEEGVYSSLQDSLGVETSLEIGQKWWGLSRTYMLAAQVGRQLGPFCRTSPHPAGCCCHCRTLSLL